jgi:hypothetical protein
MPIDTIGADRFVMCPCCRKYILHEQRTQGFGKPLRNPSSLSASLKAGRQNDSAHFVAAALALACFKGSCNYVFGQFA